jgi:hypothetical protein
MNSSDDHTKDSGASAEGFCTTCSHKVASFDGLTCCPNCGSTGTPCSNDNQVNVSINTHELRLLCIWAENWGLQIGNADPVYGIATRLRRQIGDRATLTMADEFAELRKFGVSFITNHPAADQP